MSSTEPTLLRRIVRRAYGGVGAATGALGLVTGLVVVFALAGRTDEPPGVVTTAGTTTRPPPVVTVTVPPRPQPGDGGGTEESIDDLIADLELGNIAFNAPTELSLREAAVIQLRVSGEQSIAELQEGIDAAGELEGEQIRVSDSMEARLTGRGFTIEAVTPAVQLVARRGVTEWKWEVEPTATGDRRLHLTLSALLDVGGDQEAYTVRTFERTLHVRVALSERLETFVGENWQWLWTALLVPVGGWLLHRRRGRDAEAGASLSPRAARPARRRRGRRARNGRRRPARGR